MLPRGTSNFGGEVLYKHDAIAANVNVGVACDIPAERQQELLE